MKKFLLFVAFILVFVTFTNCPDSIPADTSTTSTTTTLPPKIYAGGYYASDTVSKIACLWTFGDLTEDKITLADSTADTSQVLDIDLSGDNIYCSGSAFNAYDEACFWVYDGSVAAQVPLDTAGISYGYSVLVNGNDVYVGGSLNNGNASVCYWKNDQAGYASLYNTNGAIKGITRRGSDMIFASNYQGSFSVAAIWINDSATKIDLSNGTVADAYANAACSDGTNIYVVGTDNSVGYLWTYNGTTVTSTALLTDSSSDPATPTDICMYNGKIYISGSYDTGAALPVPCYWTNKNGSFERIDLDTAGNASSITVFDEDIYVGGSFTTSVEKACYWKNDSSGKVIPSTSDTYGSKITSILVTQ